MYLTFVLQEGIITRKFFWAFITFKMLFGCLITSWNIVTAVKLKELLHNSWVELVKHRWISHNAKKVDRCSVAINMRYVPNVSEVTVFIQRGWTSSRSYLCYYTVKLCYDSGMFYWWNSLVLIDKVFRDLSIFSI